MKIISTLEEVQKHLPVAYTGSFDRVDPFFANAEHNYVKYLIGAVQFQVLATVYSQAVVAKQASEEPTANEESILSFIEDPLIREAIFLAQKTVVNLGYYTGIPTLSLSVSDAGIQVFSSDSTKQAFKWQVDGFAASIRELGFNALEEFLQFLEESPDVFPEYIGSAEYRRNEQFLIQSCAEFSEHFNISGSRYTYYLLAYLMKRVEDQTVKKLFGAPFFDSLKSGELTDDQRILVNDYLKPGIALHTGAKAIVERIVTLKNGVASVNLEGASDENKSSAAATTAQVKEMADQLTRDGNQFLADGLEYVITNKIKFPDYVVQPTRRRYNTPSVKEKGIFLG